MKNLIRKGKDTKSIGLYYIDENGRYWYPHDDKFPMTEGGVSYLTEYVDNVSASVKMADRRADCLYAEGMKYGMEHPSQQEVIRIAATGMIIGGLITLGVVSWALNTKSKKDNKKK